MRAAAVPLLVLSLISFVGINAKGSVIDTELSRREGAVMRMKEHLETLLMSPNMTAAMLDACVDLSTISESACSSSLRDGRCSPNFGETNGCACGGRVLSTSSPVVMAATEPAHSRLAIDQYRENFATACLAHSMRSLFQGEYVDFIESGDVKWLYMGLENNNLINFPGFLWPRTGEHAVGCGAPGGEYSPLYRPWHLAGSTGPKNVVFILDVSGSMQVNGRIGMLKRSVVKILRALTHDDYVSVVTFNSEADTVMGLRTMAQALPSFREELERHVIDLEADGGTNFNAAFSRAFEVVDHSSRYEYVSGCQTAFIFLTDGQATTPVDLIQARLSQQQAADQVALLRGVPVQRERKEYFFVIGMGDNVDDVELNKLACLTKGSYNHVPDNDQDALEDALFAFRKLFSGHRETIKDEGVSWSERYVSMPNIFGWTATASVPIYDKTDPDAWRLVGVAAADSAVCSMEATLEAAYVRPVVQTTKRGCTCEPNWSYAGVEYGVRSPLSEGSCASVDWPVPWCAVNPISCPQAVCNVESISTTCWDDCSPYSPLTQMDDILYRRSDKQCARSASTAGELARIDGEDACRMHMLSKQMPLMPGQDRCEVVGHDNQCAGVGFTARSKIAESILGYIIGTSAGVGGVYDPNAPQNIPAATSAGPLVEENADDMSVCACKSQKPACICDSRRSAQAYLDSVLSARDESGKKEDEEVRFGDIIGIIVGCSFGILAVVGVMYGCKRRRVQMNRMNQSMDRQLQMQEVPGNVAQSHPPPPPPAPYATAPAAHGQAPYPVAAPGRSAYPATYIGQGAPPPGTHVYGVPATGFPVVQPQQLQPQTVELSASTSSSYASPAKGGGDPCVA